METRVSEFLLVISSFYRLKKKLALGVFHRSIRFVTKLGRQTSPFCSILDISRIALSDSGGRRRLVALRVT